MTQLQLSGWGPILDHGIGFNFDCWHHYLYTGDLEALRDRSGPRTPAGVGSAGAAGSSAPRNEAQAEE